MYLSTLVFCAGCFFAANAAMLPGNVVQDIKVQEHQLYRCWEPVDENNPSKGHTLSEPMYSMCSYMPDPKSYDKFYVNGVTEDSDDYTHIHSLFTDVHELHAMLMVCLQEGFSFYGPRHPAQVSMRCLCKRNGCNIPKDILTFMDYNKKVIPQATD